MLAAQLVTDALYLSLYDRNFDRSIDGGDETHGLQVLNELLDEWRDRIPYPFQYTFATADDLLNTQFVQVDNVSFVLGSVKYPLTPELLTPFNEINTVLNLSTIPSIYYFDLSTQSITVYPIPPNNPTYSFIVWGRQALGGLGLVSALPPNMPVFMITAVKYEVGFRLAAEVGVLWNENKERIRQATFTQLKNKTQVTLVKPRNIVFGRPGSANIPPYPYFWAISGGGPA